MRNSYFVLVSDKIDYPIYVALWGRVSIERLLERDTLWSVIRDIIQLDRDDFIVIDYCTRSNFNGALIKIDFTYPS